MEKHLILKRVWPSCCSTNRNLSCRTFCQALGVWLNQPWHATFSDARTGGVPADTLHSIPAPSCPPVPPSSSLCAHRSTATTTPACSWDPGTSTPTGPFHGSGAAVATSCGSGVRAAPSVTASAGCLPPWRAQVEGAIFRCDTISQTFFHHTHSPNLAPNLLS